VFTTTIRLSDEEKKLLDDNCLSLTKFVRLNLKNYKKSQTLAEEPEIPTPQKEVISIAP